MDAAILPLSAALLVEQVAAESQSSTTTTSEASAPAGLLACMDTDFHLSLSLEAWMPRLAGEFTDGPTNVDVSTAKLHEAEITFAATLNLRRDRLNVALRGFAFSTDGDATATTPFALGGITVASGDAFASSFSWWSAGMEIAYDFYRPLEERPTKWSEPVTGWTPPANATDFSVFALVSADVEGVSRRISDSTSGLSTDANEAFAALEFGIGFRLGFDTKESFPLLRRIEIGAKAAAGVTVPFSDGDYGGAALVEAQIAAWINHSAAAYFGYRVVGGSLDGDELGLEGSMQGLRAGLAIAF